MRNGTEVKKNKGYRSVSGANETLVDAEVDNLAPANARSGAAYVLLASFALLGTACAKNPNTEGYSPLPVEAAPVASTPTLATPVEFYFYINSDNDILGIRETGPDAGRAENQGELLFESLVHGVDALPTGVGIHLYLDRGPAIRKGDELSSETFSHCANGVLAGPAEKNGETDSRDPVHLERLLARSCAEDSKKFVILWSHGDGFRVQKDFDYDPGIPASPTSPAFHISRLIEAIPDGFAEAILFDSCSMASLEIANLVAPKARYLFSSQFLLPSDGLQYSGVWDLLRTSRDTRAILREIRAASELRFRRIGMSAPLVIVELEKLPALETAFLRAIEAGLPNDPEKYAEFRPSLLRGEKDGDVLFLLQKHGSRDALTHALDQGRGSLHFALPRSRSPASAIDADMGAVALAAPLIFRTWAEKFPTWAWQRMIPPSENSVPLPAKPAPPVSEDADRPEGAPL